MNIFITGATGYIGNQLALKLADAGNTVHALVRNPEKTKTLDHPRIKLFKGDINDINSIKIAMEGCEKVFHLAAFARLWHKPNDIFFKTNVDGTKNMLEAAMEKNISGFVYTSSTGVFGHSINMPLTESDPRTIGFDNDYELSKCLAEKLVIDFAALGLPAVIVNPSRVYGPGIESYSNPFCRLLKAIIKGKLVLLPRCGSVMANYCYVNDVVNGHILAMKYGKPGERYILGGENISFDKLIHLIKTNLRVKNAISIPKSMMKLAGYLQLCWFYLSKHQPAFTPSAIERLFKNAEFNCDKAISELHYQITPFQKGIRETIDHLKNQFYEKL